MLTDWLNDIGMVSAGPTALMDTWIGWYQPYATSHEDLDKDQDVFSEIDERRGRAREHGEADPLRPVPGAGRGAARPPRE